LTEGAERSSKIAHETNVEWLKLKTSRRPQPRILGGFYRLAFKA